MATPYRFITAALLLICAVSVSFSQDEDGERGRKRVEDYRRMKLIETLNLNEEQSIRFFAREKDFRHQEKGLTEQRQASIDRLRQLSGGSAGDADIVKELQTLASVNADILAKRRDYLLSLKDIITMKQIAQLVVFDDSFARELKRLLQNAGKRPLFRR
ncbi:MAG: hypothetical protein IPP94_09075 [Ignavibacteria bacterium]|nr:hypothetical protein [Ignavibacteria bacterium]